MHQVAAATVASETQLPTEQASALAEVVEARFAALRSGGSRYVSATVLGWFVGFVAFLIGLSSGLAQPWSRRRLPVAHLAWWTLTGRQRCDGP
jgi:hypothetical protein